MINSTFLMYIKSFFLKKRPIIDFPFLFFSALSILSFILGVKYNWDTLYLIGWGFILFSIIWLFIYLFIWDYSCSDEYRYKKRQIPKTIEDIKSKTHPDIWDYLKQLDERVKTLEKISPLRLGTYALLFSILFALAFSLISKF